MAYTISIKIYNIMEIHVCNNSDRLHFHILSYFKRVLYQYYKDLHFKLPETNNFYKGTVVVIIVCSWGGGGWNKVNDTVLI